MRSLSHSFFIDTSILGDVCRDAATQEFFCPRGCEHTKNVPYCAVPGLKAPCRVPLSLQLEKSVTEPTSSKASTEQSVSKGHVSNVVKQTDASREKQPSMSKASDAKAWLDDLKSQQIKAAIARDFALVSSLQNKIESLENGLNRGTDIIEAQELSQSQKHIAAAKTSPSSLQLKLDVLVDSNSLFVSSEIPFFFHIPRVKSLFCSFFFRTSMNSFEYFLFPRIVCWCFDREIYGGVIEDANYSG